MMMSKDLDIKISHMVAEEDVPSFSLKPEVPITYSKNVMVKRRARLFAVQFIYSYIIRKMHNDQLNAVLHDALSGEDALKINQKYAVTLITGVASSMIKLEQIVQRYLDDSWRFTRLGKVVQAILLVSAYEILFTKELSSSIIIDEYLEIAKMLNHGGEANFINSVLDNIAKNDVADG